MKHFFHYLNHVTLNLQVHMCISGYMWMCTIVKYAAQVYVVGTVL